MSDESDPLTPEQDLFARVMFQNRIYQSNGQRYQDLFVDVMTRRNVGFVPVKPQGRRGDQGNDGFIPDEGRYFQVHAPEDPKDKATAAAKKASDDFTTLKSNWDHQATVVDYRFVFNDKYLGVFPDILHALGELKRNHGLGTAKPFLASDLEREFMQLPPSEMHAVLGTVIPRREDIAELDYAALTEILQHLVDSQRPVPAEGLPSVPDYDYKLNFNNIDQAASLLRVGNYQNAAVDRYFDRHGEFTRTDIRNRLAHSYEAARVAVGEESTPQTPSGDSVFFRLLHDLAPGATKQVQDAAIVLIAYFFEKCDVFEDPTS
jgi:hypothetical protein